MADGDTIITEPGASVLSGTVGGTSVNANSIVSLSLDPSKSGVLYAGASKGLLRSYDFGKTWEALNIIESSKKFPISAVAVNPKNSSEIVYVSALTLYKSIDSGVSWSTHQIASDKSVYLLQYDGYNPEILYIGFKK